MGAVIRTLIPVRFTPSMTCHCCSAKNPHWPARGITEAWCSSRRFIRFFFSIRRTLRLLFILKQPWVFNKETFNLISPSLHCGLAIPRLIRSVESFQRLADRSQSRPGASPFPDTYSLKRLMLPPHYIE